MTITIQQSRAVNGPNIWTRAPIAHLLVAIDFSSSTTTPAAPLVAQRLTELLTSFVAPAYRVAPRDPLPYPTDLDLPSLLGLIALNLQRAAGIPMVFSATRAIGGTNLYETVVQQERTEIGLAACSLAVRLLNHISFGAEPDLNLRQEVVTRFAALSPSRGYSTVTQAIRDAASRRDIPVAQIDPQGRIIDLSTGPYRKRVLGSRTSFSSTITESIVRDKFVTNHYLRAAGLPTPHGRIARTVAQAVAAANEIGYPVVLKPADGGASKGVFVNVRAADDVRSHFDATAATSDSGRVLVEQYLTGQQYRVVVVADQIIAITHRIPAFVVGDGLRTVQELMDLANADPRRGSRRSDPLRTISVNDQMMTVLTEQGLTLDATPAASQHVQLKLMGSDHQGDAVNVTDQAHPDNLAIVRQAAQVVGADVAAMDVIAEDIAQSIWTTSGAIIDVNTNAGFIFEILPSMGFPLDPGSAIVNMLFPPGQPVRATIIAVAGQADSESATSELITHLMTESSASVGLSSNAGLVIAGARMRDNDIRDPKTVHTLLANPAAEIVVAQIDPLGIMDQGLGFTYCDVAVITALSGLLRPMGQPVETVLTGLCDAAATLVLSADDPAVVALAAEFAGSVMLISHDADSAVVRAHVGQGGRAVVRRQSPTEEVVLLQAETVTPVLSGREIPRWDGCSPDDMLTSVLAGTAAALARDIPLATIQQAVGSFAPL